MPLTCPHRALCGVILALVACGPPPPLREAAEPRVSLPDEPPPRPPAPAPAPAPSVHPGVLTGATLATLQVPMIEQGLRGALQALPTLRTSSPERLHATWMGIKRDGDLREQHKRLHGQHARPSGTTDLVDLWRWENKGLPPFGRRDRVRQRTWVTRTMAAVLIRAWELFHAKHPAARLTVGDLAQPFGGNILHNELVRKVGGEDALRLLNQARLEGGRWIVEEHLSASDFGPEISRFESPEDAVLVRHELTAQLDEGGPLGLRTSTIRYTFPRRVTAEEQSSAFGTFAAIAKRGTRVSSEVVRHFGESGETERRWRDHWVDSAKKRQLITYSRKRQKKRLRMRDVETARMAKWQQRKPGSLPREQRWVREAPDAHGDRAWTRWQAMREAGHVSHMSGSDADISFVTHRNTRHFAIDLSVFNAELTWAWFQSVEAAAKELGTAIDVVLISRPIIRALERHLSPAQERSALWRKMRRAAGHDAHHHLRLEAPTKRSDARARALLEGLAEP